QAEWRAAFQEALTILAALVELLPAGDPRWAEVVEALSWDAQWVVDHRADAYAGLAVPAMRAMDEALEGLADPTPRAGVKMRLANFLAFGPGELEDAERGGRRAVALLTEAVNCRGVR